MSIWGRLLGGAAGFALGDPLGAILAAINLAYYKIKEIRAKS